MSSVPSLSPGRKILKVQELTARIRSEMESQFSDIWVEGEVTNLKIPSSGHLYFTLKDTFAQIKAIIFRSHGRFLRFTPKEGQAVLIRGHLTLYEAKGEYQLIVDYIEPKGAGALQAAFEALKERLRVEGLFREERKRAIPLLALKIGVITSPTGAALRDILKVMTGGRLPFHILIYPVSVQGGAAADEIGRALQEMNQFSEKNLSPAAPIDLIILARGGGSLEDLWAFNEEIVARAIARSQIPVISAVGHESDTTIADFVADLRAATPSVAAELVVRNAVASLQRLTALQGALQEGMKKKLEARRNQIRSELRLLADPARQIGHFSDDLAHLAIRLRQALHRSIEGRRSRLSPLRQGLAHLNPVERLKDWKQQLGRLTIRLTQEGNNLIVRQRRLLQSQMVQLNILSPLNILDRGYSITRKTPSLDLVRDADSVELRDQIEITLRRGKLICSVDGKAAPNVPEGEEERL